MTTGISLNSNFSLRELFTTASRLEDGFRKLSEGKRITRAGDDAAGLGIASRLRALEVTLNQGIRNINDGISVVRTAEGGLDSTSANLTRMRELAMQAQNGTVSEGDRQALQEEYDQLAAEITRTSESTSFNGLNLLNGTLQGSEALTLADGQGSQETTIEIGDQSAEALGVAGQSVADPDTLTAIDNAIDLVSSTRGELGTASKRLESRVRTLQQSHENVAAARSRIEDLDIAQGLADQTRTAILRQGQISLFGRSRMLQEVVLRLLT